MDLVFGDLPKVTATRDNGKTIDKMGKALINTE